MFQDIDGDGWNSLGARSWWVLHRRWRNWHGMDLGLLRSGNTPHRWPDHSRTLENISEKTRNHDTSMIINQDTSVIVNHDTSMIIHHNTSMITNQNTSMIMNHGTSMIINHDNISFIIINQDTSMIINLGTGILVTVSFASWMMSQWRILLELWANMSMGYCRYHSSELAVILSPVFLRILLENRTSLFLAVFLSLIPVLKHKGGMHPKAEGECCNHLDYVDPACDCLGQKFRIVKAHEFNHIRI